MMKKRWCRVFLATLLLLSLSACGTKMPEKSPVGGSVQEQPAQTQNANAPEGQMAPQQPQGSAAPAQQGQLSVEAAQQIALSHAQCKVEEVKMLRTEYDREGREYEVDFIHNGWEYEYEIHAFSGNVLSYDKERLD